MSLKKLAAASILILYILFVHNTLLSGNTEVTSQDEQEYERDFNRVEDMRASLRQSDTRDLHAYEVFADSIVQKWRGRNREYYGRLILDICAPLSSGTFKDDRQYELERKYALSALQEPDSIPLILELELIGHVTTFVIGPGAPSGEDLARRRVEDTSIRLHAWKRLLEAIDRNWVLGKNNGAISVTPPEETGFPSGVAPEAIQDSALRAEYEEAIRLNKQKLEEHSKQYEYHKWLKRIPTLIENNIIREYSHPPYNTKELETLLNEYQIDQETKTRIIEAVEKNIKEAQEGTR